MEMFSSFFSALQTFVSELTASSTDLLNTVELGEYMVLITRVSEISSDLVIIIDNEDLKEAQKITPKITKTLINHGDLFTNWDQEPEKLERFDQKIIKLILSNKKLISESSLTANQSSILKSIWGQKGALSEQLRENLSKRREELTENYLNEQNYLRKYEMSKKLIDFSEKLQDDEKFIEYQTEANSLKDEITDRKLRIQYYLGKVKESLEYSRYAETYSYLYSLSSKLKNFAEPKIIEKYKKFAKILINRAKVSKALFRQSVRALTDVEDELNKFLTYEL